MPVARVARSERIAALAQRHGALAVLLLAVLGGVARLRLVRHVRQPHRDQHPVVVPHRGRARDDVRHHHRRHRPVGRLGVRARRRGGRVGQPVRAGAGAARAAAGVRGGGAASTGWSSRTPGWRRSSSRSPACSARAACCSRSPTRARRRTWCRATRPLLGARPGHAARVRLPGVDRGAAVRSRRRAAAADPVRSGRVRDRGQRGRGCPDGSAGGPHQGAHVPVERPARRVRRRAQRGPARARASRSSVSAWNSTRSRPWSSVAHC